MLYFFCKKIILRALFSQTFIQTTEPLIGSAILTRQIKSGQNTHGKYQFYL